MIPPLPCSVWRELARSPGWYWTCLNCWLLTEAHVCLFNWIHYSSPLSNLSSQVVQPKDNWYNNYIQSAKSIWHHLRQNWSINALPFSETSKTQPIYKSRPAFLRQFWFFPLHVDIKISTLLVFLCSQLKAYHFLLLITFSERFLSYT